MHSIRVGGAVNRLLVTTAAVSMVALVSRKHTGADQRATPSHQGDNTRFKRELYDMEAVPGESCSKRQSSRNYIYCKIKKTSHVRSNISSKLMFASCVGYFDRAYYGFYVTPSRMLVLIEGDKM